MAYTKQKQIFLAHASEDKQLALDLYGKLFSRGLEPWLDKENLIPGQNWKIEIPTAIKKSTVFVACLSNQSIQKQGYVQKEFRLALDTYAQKPPGTIFLIPLKFDDCKVPDIRIPDLDVGLRDLQWIDFWKPDGFERLIKAITLALNSSSTNTARDNERSIIGQYLQKDTSAHKPSSQHALSMEGTGEHSNIREIKSNSLKNSSAFTPTSPPLPFPPALVHTLRGHTKPVTTIAFSPDDNQLASGSSGLIFSGKKPLRFWNPISGKQLESIDTGDGVNSISFSPDGRLLACASG